MSLTPFPLNPIPNRAQQGVETLEQLGLTGQAVTPLSVAHARIQQAVERAEVERATGYRFVGDRLVPPDQIDRVALGIRLGNAIAAAVFGASVRLKSE